MKANRFFYRIDKQGNPIPGTLVRLKAKPINGSWKEVPSNVCCESGGVGSCEMIIAEPSWPTSFSIGTDVTISVCGQEIIINNIVSSTIPDQQRYSAVFNTVDYLNNNHSDLGVFYSIGNHLSGVISPSIGLIPAIACEGDFTVDFAIIP